MNQNLEAMLQKVKDEIRDLKLDGQLEEIGYVISVGDGIAFLRGLQGVLSGELLKFNERTYGFAMNLEENQVGVVILGNAYVIKEGDPVYRTHHIVEIGVGDELLGRVVDALGRAIDGKGEIDCLETRPIEKLAPGVMTRQSVHQPLQTGIKIIDAMIPIGKGQRELIIGDRQTGKTSIALNTIINQKGKKVKCVYVAIGQKASSVAQFVEKLRQHDALDYTVIISSAANELAPMQYIAPYAGCSIAEYWMEKGEDTLIVYDDLSKHAVAYRTISLLLRRPSGREAYPGDVFYLHSRLLERSAKLNEHYGSGSMTALPIIETLSGDISAYIPTNVISITDGQLFLNQDAFNAGRRPAVDSGLSVSRVGSAAQTKAMKQVSSSLKLELATYHDLQAFAQFSSDVDEETMRVIEHGKRLSELMKQGTNAALPHALIVLSLFMNKYGYLDRLDVTQVLPFEAYLHQAFLNDYGALLEAIDGPGGLSDQLIESLKQSIDLVLADFLVLDNVK